MKRNEGGGIRPARPSAPDRRRCKYRGGMYLLCACALAMALGARVQSAETDRLPPEYTQNLQRMGGKEYDAAINGFKQLIAQDWQFHAAYKKIVECYQAQKNWPPAEAYFQLLIRQNPQNAYAYYGLGLLYKAQGDYKKADEFFKQSIQRAPLCADVFDQFGATSQKLNALGDAIRRLTDLCQSQPDYPYGCYGLGYAYQLQRKWTESLTYLDQALARDPDLIAAHRAKGDVYFDTKRFPDASAAYEKALTRLEETNDLEGQERVLSLTGSAYSNFGDYTKALEYYPRALTISRALGRRRNESFILTHLGEAHLRLSRHAQAEDYFRQALAIAQEIKDRLGMGNSLYRLGVLYRQLGDHPKALDHYQQAQAIYQELGERDREGEVLAAIGVIHANQGDWTRALDYYGRARDLFVKRDDPARIAAVLNRLGLVYATLGEYGQALELQRQALKLHRKVSNRREEGNTYSDIGFVYEKKGDYRKALDHYRQALVIHEELKNYQAKATTLSNIGHAYNKLGYRAKALSYFQQSLDLSRQTGQPGIEGQTLCHIGETHVQLNHNAQAFEHFAAARRIGEAINHPEITWFAILGLAQACERRRQVSEALDYYKQAIAVIEKMREGFVLTEHRSGFLQDRLAAYEGLVNLLLDQHARAPGQGYDREAFAYVERFRARALLDALAESSVEVRAGIGEPQRAREREIFRTISQLQSALQTERSDARRQALQAERAQAEEQLERFLLELRRTNPHYAELKYPEPYDLQKVQREALAPGEWLLEYMIGRKSSRLFLISKDRFQVVRLPGRAAIESAVLRYRRLISQNPEGPAIAENFRQIYRESHALYQMLLGPVRVPDGIRLIIVADGALHYLPFEALTTRLVQEGEGPSYWLAEHEISYAPSVSILGLLRKETPARPSGVRRQQLLAFADPVVARSWAGANGQAPAPLPYARGEVKSIARLYPRDQSQMYLGAQATESAFKKEDLTRYRYIHLATHGRIDEEIPARSGLWLGRDGEEDGLLQMREIFNLALNAELVVLSACNTGLGKMMRGEGLLSLTRAFLYAGAPRLLVSLWEVQDETTAEMMKGFYQDLQKGRRPAQALRTAKLSLLRSPRPAWHHPYFWAPFVLTGKP